MTCPLLVAFVARHNQYVEQYRQTVLKPRDIAGPGWQRTMATIWDLVDQLNIVREQVGLPALEFDRRYEVDAGSCGTYVDHRCRRSDDCPLYLALDRLHDRLVLAERQARTQREMGVTRTVRRESAGMLRKQIYRLNDIRTALGLPIRSPLQLYSVTKETTDGRQPHPENVPPVLSALSA